MKLLSIAVPSYNVEKTLEATLRSLCLPSLLPALDIMVIDDGSTDGTADLARTFAEQYPDSVRVISQPNKGHGGAVNTGIAAAAGRYFKVVDGDDTLSAEGFAQLLSCLHTSQADLVLAHYEKVSVSDPHRPMPMRFEGVEFGRVYPFAELPMDSGLYFGIHSITIRTDLLRQNHIHLQEHTFYVDVEYGLLPLPYIQTVIFLDHTVYRYAVGQVSQSIAVDSFVRRYDDHERVTKRMASFVRETPLSDVRKEYAYSVLRKLCFTQYMIAAFYDPDLQRGGWRARRFDAWLRKNDPKLYDMMGENAYLRLLRRTRFLFLRTAFTKAFLNKSYQLSKSLFRNKRKFTY